MRLVCFANPGSPRVAGLAAACRSASRTVDLCVIPWLEVIHNKWDRSLLRGDDVRLRLESPGKDAAVEQALLIAGADEPDEADDMAGSPGKAHVFPLWRMTRKQVLSERWEKGRIPPLRQWYLGWRKVLRALDTAAGPDVRWFTPPEDVISMFDKDQCQQRLEKCQCPVPRSLGLPRNYFHSLALTARTGCTRFFLKPCHGSSSSGIMAIEHGPEGLQAFTTVELVQLNPVPVMFNSRKVRRLRDTFVANAADAVGMLHTMAQAWVPKAGWQDRTMDLRVVTIGGKPAHIVPRLSRSPLTTLQLGAKRGDTAALRTTVGETAWQRLLDAATRAAAAYPRALVTGVDVAMTPGWSRAAVLEVNAFGDFLPGVLHEGQDTYTSQLAAAGIM